MELLEVEDSYRVDEPAHDGRVRAAPGARPAAARRRRAARDRPARGHLVHARRQPAALAEVVAARRLQPPRGHGPAHGRLRRRRAHAAGRAPAVVRRDGRALPRSDARPLPPHRVRHRRVGPRLHDDLAGARLRLPGRDRLPRRRAARHARRAVRDPQRDLHPRGGQRGPLEARRRADRRGGAASAPARPLLPRHGRQLRVPRLLAPVPGRQHRVRGARDRDHGHDALPRRASSRPTGRSSTSAPTRRSTSTSSSRGSTSTSTARPTPSTRPSPRRSRSARTTRTASRSCSATRRCAPSRRASRTTTGTRSAPGRSSTTDVANGLGTPVGYKLVPGAAIPHDARPGLARAGPRRGDRPHAVGDAVRPGRALALRRVRRPEPPGRRRRPARLDRGATARSRTRTSSCGTCSGSTTSPARRNGP